MHQILLVGSSIFQQWGKAEGLAPGDRIINRAVGGTVTDYWLEHLPSVLEETQPDEILLYCGSNDLNAEVTDEAIVANTARCRAIAEELCPRAKFAWFSIIKAPQKAGKWERIDAINAAIRALLAPDDLYVESNEVFCPADEAVTQFYVEDQLHLTVEAYAALSRYAQARLSTWRVD